jgi:hypothetical protein
MIPERRPIVIRGSGTTHAISRWLCSLFVGGLLLLAAANVQRWDSAAPLLIVLAAFFAAMLLYTETLRVELNGDEISYGHFFNRRRSLRLDQIRSVRGLARSTGRGGSGHYLLVSPIDREIAPLKMRMDFFSPADGRTIRNFFGDKLKRYGKKK